MIETSSAALEAGASETAVGLVGDRAGAVRVSPAASWGESLWCFRFMAQAPAVDHLGVGGKVGSLLFEFAIVVEKHFRGIFQASGEFLDLLLFLVKHLQPFHVLQEILECILSLA